MRKMARLLVFILALCLFSVTVPLAAEEKVPAPDFKLPDLKGNSVALSGYKGKQPVLLFFWTTRCPLCVKALKVLKQKQPDLSAVGLEVLCLDIGESEDRVMRFMQKNSLTCRVLLDTDAGVAYSYEVIGVPTYILVDKQGNIVFTDFSFPFDDYKELLSEFSLNK